MVQSNASSYIEVTGITGYRAVMVLVGYYETGFPCYGSAYIPLGLLNMTYLAAERVIGIPYENTMMNVWLDGNKIYASNRGTNQRGVRVFGVG